MIVVDIETTGINPYKSSIVSIGAIDFKNPSSFFYEECRVWDGAEIIKEALKVNGFTLEQVQDPSKKSLQEIMAAFLAWTKNSSDKTIGGANVFWDHDFLRASAKRYNLEWSFTRRIVDLHSVCYSHFLRRGLKAVDKNGKTELTVDAILKYVGLPEEPKPHVGLVGAKMEAEAFSRLIYGKALLPEYQHFPLPDYLV